MDKFLSYEGLQLAVVIVVALVGSAGFWTWMTKREERRAKKEEERAKNSPLSRLVLGLAHDRIIFLALEYKERGCLREDEYENLVDYLHKPYCEMGGNGTATRLVEDVKRLPIVKLLTNIQPLKECIDEQQNV